MINKLNQLMHDEEDKKIQDMFVILTGARNIKAPREFIDVVCKIAKMDVGYKMTEKEWVKDQLIGRPRDWQDIVRSGRCELNLLEEGELRNMFDVFLTIESEIEQKLEEYECEAG